MYSDVCCILVQDDDEAINKSNVLKRGDVLRHAKPQSAIAYNEGEDLPEEAE